LKKKHNNVCVVLHTTHTHTHTHTHILDQHASGCLDVITAYHINH